MTTYENKELIDTLQQQAQYFEQLTQSLFILIGVKEHLITERDRKIKQLEGQKKTLEAYLVAMEEKNSQLFSTPLNKN